MHLPPTPCSVHRDPARAAIKRCRLSRSFAFEANKKEHIQADIMRFPKPPFAVTRANNAQYSSTLYNSNRPMVP